MKARIIKNKISDPPDLKIYWDKFMGEIYPVKAVEGDEVSLEMGMNNGLTTWGLDEVELLNQEE